jgi:peptide methionine sulfoxide reductase msrA/msrB
LLLVFGGWVWWNTNAKKTHTQAQKQLRKAATSTQQKDMIVAGGCFWCVEADMQKAPGVQRVISGYSGGDLKQPTYETYAKGGHREVVRVLYNPNQVTYRQLLYYFLKHIDPTDEKGSFVDRGVQYSPAIYFENQEQKKIAESVLADIAKRDVFDEKLQVPVLRQNRFWKAEEYHQDYYKKNPVRYKIYRKYSGRDSFIKTHWGEDADDIPPYKDVGSETEDTGIHKSESRGSAAWMSYEKPSVNQLKEQLSPLEYKVIVEDGTEPAFENEYYDNRKPGIYVDALSGEPLFSSKNKYNSGTGWPSFTKPLVPENIELKADYSLGVRRTEVRSRYGDAHLGHVFNDGPTTKEKAAGAKATGLRYCLNSAALEFIPKEAMAARGYGQYLSLFEDK